MADHVLISVCCVPLRKVQNGRKVQKYVFSDHELWIYYLFLFQKEGKAFIEEEN